MAMAQAEDFYRWLKTFLKDRGLQFSQSGFKLGASLQKHELDLSKGDWLDIAYSRAKPIRWLFNIDVTTHPPTAVLPGNQVEAGIGASNTSQGDKAGLAVRIMPLLQTGPDTFERRDDFEVQALFLFPGALSSGTSGDGFTFNIATGELRRKHREDYIFAALLGLQDRGLVTDLLVDGQITSVTYGDVLDALRAAITVELAHGQPRPIPVFDMTLGADVDQLKSDLANAWDTAATIPAMPTDDDDAPPAPVDFAQLVVPENPDLLGIDPSVYRQVNAMLQSGKQHIMLYGPPGTGKTSLARWIGSSLPGEQWTLITGSADWSSQDIIGGYQPLGGGEVDFVPGILLRAFDQPLIIDELNRCDIDKVIGPLFTVLSGQQTTLPYRTELANKNSQPFVILPHPKANPAPHEFAPGPGWRLIATINSIDKASLYQMSYALSRRFGWVYVDAPADLKGFIRDFLSVHDNGFETPLPEQPCPLATLWEAINAVRVIGPAPIIDAIRAIGILTPDASLFGAASDALRLAALDTLDMIFLPMLDGIVRQDAMAIADTMIAAFGFEGSQAVQVRARLESISI